MNPRLCVANLFVLAGILTVMGVACQSSSGTVERPMSGVELEQAIRSHTNKGIQLGERGMYNQAIREFEKILKLDPGNSGAYKNLGVAYCGKGDFERAVESLGKAIENGLDDADTHFFRGLIYVKYLEQDEQGIPDLTKAIELDPTRERAYLNRGLAYYMVGEFEESIHDLTTLLEMDPSNAKNVLDWRARSYTKLGQYREAWADVHDAERLGIQVDARTLEELKKASGQNE